MAIKGKAKTRGRGRAPARAPKPVVVTPKRPFLARRSTQVGVLLLLLAGIAAILLVAWDNQREEQERERQGVAVNDIGERIELALQSLAQPGPTGQLVVLPEFVQQVQTLRSPEARPRDFAQARRAARELVQPLRQAAEQLDAIEIPEGLRPEHSVDLAEATTVLAQSIRAYRTAVQLVVLAADLDGEPRGAALARASDQVVHAATLFDLGSSKIQQLRIDLGTVDPTQLQPEVGQPGAPIDVP